MPEAPPRSLPTSAYVDPTVALLENAAIFQRSWHLAAPAYDVSNAGAQIAVDIANVPVILVRDVDGTLRGFRNICPHRGFPLVQGRENRRSVQCLYHGWTWDLDGGFRSAPRESPACDHTDINLSAVSVAEWNGLVFANLLPDADFWLAHESAIKLSAAHNIDLSEYRYWTKATTRIAANWKLWVENACECYHCPTIHSASFARSFDVSPSVYEFVCDGSVIGQFAPARVNDNVRLRQLHLWPTSYVSVDNVLGFAGCLTPNGQGRAQLETFVFVRRGAAAKDVSPWLEMYNTTAGEDIATIEAIQKSLMATDSFEPHPLPDTERAVIHFQALVRTALASMS